LVLSGAVGVVVDSVAALVQKNELEGETIIGRDTKVKVERTSAAPQACYRSRRKSSPPSCIRVLLNVMVLSAIGLFLLR